MYGQKIPTSYRKCVTITPSDTAVLNPVPKALLCLTTGNLYFVLDGDGTTVHTLAAVAANAILPFSAKMVKATTTTGTWAALY